MEPTTPTGVRALIGLKYPAIGSLKRKTRSPSLSEEDVEDVPRYRTPRASSGIFPPPEYIHSSPSITQQADPSNASGWSSRPGTNPNYTCLGHSVPTTPSLVARQPLHRTRLNRPMTSAYTAVKSERVGPLQELYALARESVSTERVQFEEEERHPRSLEDPYQGYTAPDTSPGVFIPPSRDPAKPYSPSDPYAGPPSIVPGYVSPIAPASPAMVPAAVPPISSPTPDTRQFLRTVLSDLDSQIETAYHQPRNAQIEMGHSVRRIELRLNGDDVDGDPVAEVEELCLELRSCEEEIKRLEEVRDNIRDWVEG